MEKLGVSIMGLSMIIHVVSGIFCAGLFVYGVFTIVFTSVAMGGYYVGLSILGGIASSIVAVMLAFIGSLMANK